MTSGMCPAREMGDAERSNGERGRAFTARMRRGDATAGDGIGGHRRGVLPVGTGRVTGLRRRNHGLHQIERVVSFSSGILSPLFPSFPNSPPPGRRSRELPTEVVIN